MGFELINLVAIGTDYIGSYISNYHTITTTTTQSDSFHRHELCFLACEIDKYLYVSKR